MTEILMTAPPSTARKIVAVPELFQTLIDARGTKGKFVGAEETDSPWVPFGENAAIKHLAFDVRVFLLADGEIAHHGDESGAHGADDGRSATAARRRVLAREVVKEFLDGALLDHWLQAISLARA